MNDISLLGGAVLYVLFCAYDDDQKKIINCVISDAESESSVAMETKN